MSCVLKTDATTSFGNDSSGFGNGLLSASASSNTGFNSGFDPFGGGHNDRKCALPNGFDPFSSNNTNPPAATQSSGAFDSFSNSHSATTTSNSFDIFGSSSQQQPHQQTHSPRTAFDPFASAPAPNQGNNNTFDMFGQPQQSAATQNDGFGAFSSSLKGPQTTPFDPFSSNTTPSMTPGVQQNPFEGISQPQSTPLSEVVPPAASKNLSAFDDLLAPLLG